MTFTVRAWGMGTIEMVTRMRPWRFVGHVYLLLAVIVTIGLVAHPTMRDSHGYAAAAGAVVWACGAYSADRFTRRNP